MPNNATVNFNIGTLPAAFNPGGSWQVVLNEFFKVVTAYLPGSYSLFNYGNTTPAVADQGKPWIRTNVDGSPDRTYVYFNGKWVARNPIDASSSERRLWVGSLANLYLHDGGDGVDPTVTAPTATTGAMWEEDTTFRDKLPMGVLAATGQVQTVGATAGALTSVIAEANLPEHVHYMFSIRELAGANGTTVASSHSVDRQGGQNGTGDREYAMSGSDLTTYPPTVGQTSKVGSGTALPIVPPVVGVYISKRTVRQFYTV